MSIKEKSMIYLMRFGLKMMQNPKIMNWAENSLEKKKQKRLRREDKLGAFARSWKIATADEIIRAYHAIRELKYDMKELTKKLETLQKEINELKKKNSK